MPMWANTSGGSPTRILSGWTVRSWYSWGWLNNKAHTGSDQGMRGRTAGSTRGTMPGNARWRHD